VLKEAMDVEPSATSQTDESKAEQIHQDSMRNRGENFADVVLNHYPSIIRLCQSLAACKSSSLCMLANVSQKTAFSNLSEPSNVGDAVFHVLALLAKRTSDKKLVLPPLWQFLSHAPQLSEPLLWFILQVLNTEDSIRNFLSVGECRPPTPLRKANLSHSRWNRDFGEEFRDEQQHAQHDIQVGDHLHSDAALQRHQPQFRCQHGDRVGVGVEETAAGDDRE
jgi:hypothetical protein